MAHLLRLPPGVARTYDGNRNVNESKQTPMRSTAQKKLFFESPEGRALRQELTEIFNDPAHNTKSTYTAASLDRLSFIDKHMNYMGNFPDMNHRQYVSNIKLMTRMGKVQK